MTNAGAINYKNTIIYIIAYFENNVLNFVNTIA